MKIGTGLISRIKGRFGIKNEVDRMVSMYTVERFKIKWLWYESNRALRERAVEVIRGSYPPKWDDVVGLGKEMRRGSSLEYLDSICEHYIPIEDPPRCGFCHPEIFKLETHSGD